MSYWFDLEQVNTFVAGTVGAPGKRVFYIQAKSGVESITIKCEKQQVAVLADYLEKLLADVPPASAQRPEPPELRQPVVADWTLGSLGLGYERDTDVVFIVAEELVVEEEQDEDDYSSIYVDNEVANISEGQKARFRLTRDQTASFISQARSLVSSGRPTCFLCMAPMDPDGHACPRLN